MNMILIYDDLKKSVAFSVIIEGISIGCDFMFYSVSTLFVPNVNTTNVFSYTISYFMGIGSMLLQIIIMIIIVSVFRNKDDNKQKIHDWIRYLIFPSFTLLMICAFLGAMNAEEKTSLNIFGIILAMSFLLMNIGVFYFLDSEINRKLELEKSRLMAEHSQELYKMYQRIYNERNELGKETHEFKNKVNAWSSLMEIGEYKKLSKLLNAEAGKVYTNSNIINSGCKAFDVVINAKYYEATENSIDITFDINDLSPLKIDDAEMITLLSNLLSNAIEACINCDNTTERKITIKAVLIRNMFVLTVSNSYSGMINKQMKTTKMDADKHGYGIGIIKSIVSRYNGTYYTEINDSLFITYISLPL
ncbi:MAG: ATP-binding protein [Saccharofermentans sp.]|nr:ATP-binding protein [Saccharofermentans sp.]